MKNNFKNQILFFANFFALNKTLKYLPKILDCEVSSNPFKCFKANTMLRWGMKPTRSGLLTDKLAGIFDKNKIYIEDGFIRSIEAGLSGEPTISIIYDEISPYYNAEVLTSLQNAMNSNYELKDAEILLCQEALDLIKKHKISKFNFTTKTKLNFGKTNSHKILLIDQRKGDYSVLKGLANENSFRNMLQTAIEKYPESEIIIKTHPDNKFNGYDTYLSREFIDSLDCDRIIILDDDVNPYCAIEEVDIVFTVTSQMGFEALIAGKEVHCFGMPFYAGRGITKDYIKTPEFRFRDREILEVFYFTYFEFSKYYNPHTQKTCDVFGAIDYIIKSVK